MFGNTNTFAFAPKTTEANQETTSSTSGVQSTPSIFGGATTNAFQFDKTGNAPLNFFTHIGSTNDGGKQGASGQTVAALTASGFGGFGSPVFPSSNTDGKLFSSGGNKIDSKLPAFGGFGSVTATSGSSTQASHFGQFPTVGNPVESVAGNPLTSTVFSGGFGSTVTPPFSATQNSKPSESQQLFGGTPKPLFVAQKNEESTADKTLASTVPAGSFGGTFQQPSSDAPTYFASQTPKENEKLSPNQQIFSGMTKTNFGAPRKEESAEKTLPSTVFAGSFGEAVKQPISDPPMYFAVPASKEDAKPNESQQIFGTPKPLFMASKSEDTGQPSVFKPFSLKAQQKPAAVFGGTPFNQVKQTQNDSAFRSNVTSSSTSSFSFVPSETSKSEPTTKVTSAGKLPSATKAASLFGGVSMNPFGQVTESQKSSTFSSNPVSSSDTFSGFAFRKPRAETEKTEPVKNILRGASMHSTQDSSTEFGGLFDTPFGQTKNPQSGAKNASSPSKTVSFAMPSEVEQKEGMRSSIGQIMRAEPVLGSSSANPFVKVNQAQKSNLTGQHGGLLGSSKTSAFGILKSVDRTEAQSSVSVDDIDDPVLGEKRKPKKEIVKSGVFGQAITSVLKTAKGESIPRKRLSSDSSASDGSSLMKKFIDPVDIEKITAIICQDVPDDLLDKRLILEHFSRFGNISRVSCNNKKKSAVIHYNNHEAASVAKKNGAKSGPFSSVKIYYSQTSPVVTKSSVAREDKHKLDPEVEEELRSLGSTSSYKKAERVKAVEKKTTSPARGKTTKSKEVETKSISSSSNSDLHAILKLPAFSAGERYRVLDARDRLVRQSLRGKRVDLGTALVGSCPDMCPEKERYMRQEQRQLSSYEMISDKDYTLDHSACVKQYSRSSADQEEPLPHELRPSPILSLAMDYLVVNIMDRSEYVDENLAEWYHFVWDRTRGIRKDITQQQLCDPIAVSLVEKCARFHIHCAARLCEEDMSTFDQKINNENLTKCMKTLKEMYYDLHINGIQCENEAEFRAYDVLLNLNEGDILRQVQQLPDELTNSRPVKTALALFSALNSNNYVAFFKLVRTAGYLDACILQRYFNQVRTRALQIMVRAYCPSTVTLQYPMAEFMGLLGFEGPTEATLYAESHGLTVDSSLNAVKFQRSAFHFPETAVALFRSLKLIECKRTCSVGEIVNGGPLPDNPYEYHVPHCSFDERGYLTHSALMALDQGGSGPSATPSSEISASQSVAVQQEDSVTSSVDMEMLAIYEEVSEEIVTEVITDVVNTLSRALCQSAHKDAIVMNAVQSVGSTFFSEEIKQICSDIVKGVHQECRQEYLQRQLAHEREIQAQKEKELVRNTALNEVSDEIMDDNILTLVKKVSENVLVEEMCSELLFEDIYKEDFADNVHHIAVDTLAKVNANMKTSLEKATKEIRLMQLRNCFVRWKKRAAQRNKSHLELPKPCMPLSIAEQSERLDGRGTVPIAENVSVQLQRRKEIEQKSELAHCLQELRASVYKQQLDIMAIVGNLLVKQHSVKRQTFWKLLVSLPPQSDELNKWTYHKLYGKTTDMARFSATVDNYHEVFVCVRTCTGELSRRQSQGTGALLFLCEKGSNLTAERQRLLHLISSMPKIPPVPVLVLVFGDDDCTTPAGSAEGLDLPNLLRRHLISGYDLRSASKREPKASLMLQEGLKWLAEHSSSSPSLTVLSLRGLLECYIAEQVTVSFYQDFSKRRKRGLPHRMPLSLISLYNAALSHVARVFESHPFHEYSWPIPEFAKTDNPHDWQFSNDIPSIHWNDTEYLAQIATVINTLKLPLPPPITGTSWDEICENVKEYCHSVGHSSVYNASVTDLLVKCCHWYGAKSETDDQSELTVNSVPWTDIIQASIQHKLSSVPFGEFVVAVDKCHFGGFEYPSEWLQELTVIQVEKATPLRNPMKRKTETELTVSPVKRCTPVQKMAEEFSEHFSSQLENEYKQCLETEKNLAKILQDGTLPVVLDDTSPPSTPCRVQSNSSCHSTPDMSRDFNQLFGELNASKMESDAFEERLKQYLLNGQIF